MCLILLAHEVRPDRPLVFAANRDEFFERPTAPAEFWADAPGLLAGRDLRAGGTWMGVTREGRWAAVTNFRGPGVESGELRSRGHLVRDFLVAELAAGEYIDQVAERADEYAGFNLLVGDGSGVLYFGNRGGGVRELQPGIYGLSNHLLDTSWPKVERGKRALASLLEDPSPPEPEALLEILYDTEIAPDRLLPETGIGIELERLASAPFIVSPSYGTRASTVLLRDGAGRITFVERTFRPGPERDGDARFDFDVQPPG